MLEEADQCSEGESAFPGLITQDREENSILRRIIGANKGKARRSRSFIRAQQEAIDLVLDPGLPEVFKVKEEPENGSQLKSLHLPICREGAPKYQNTDSRDRSLTIYTSLITKQFV